MINCRRCLAPNWPVLLSRSISAAVHSKFVQTPKQCRLVVCSILFATFGHWLENGPPADEPFEFIISLGARCIPIEQHRCLVWQLRRSLLVAENGHAKSEYSGGLVASGWMAATAASIIECVHRGHRSLDCILCSVMGAKCDKPMQRRTRLEWRKLSGKATLIPGPATGLVAVKGKSDFTSKCTASEED